MKRPADAPVPAREPAEYRCALCDARWSYAAVRHLARCRDCGGGLVRAKVLHDTGGPGE